MSLLNFLDFNKKRGPKEPRTLIAIDWDRVKGAVRDLSFLGDYQNPQIWIFTKRSASEAHIKDLIGDLPYEVKSAPDYEGRLSMYICYSVFHEVFGIGQIHQVLLIAGDEYLDGAIQYLQEQSITAEIKVFSSKPSSGPRGRKDQRENRDQGKPSSNKPAKKGPPNNRKPPKDKDQEPLKDTKDKRSGDKKGPPPIKDPDEIAEKISSIIKNKIELNQEQTLSRLGHLIKAATGSSVTYLIGQKGNRVLLDSLIQEGLAEDVNERSFMLKDYPKPETIKPLIFRHKSGNNQKTGPKGKGRNSGPDQESANEGNGQGESVQGQDESRNHSPQNPNNELSKQEELSNQN